ncbi:MAG: YihY/virulence factor BrkB family protein [Rhodocyclaceae bacterium]|nr:YihY/virulence factor BrkB family protein [Rhodocyclaceae bacterium]
MQAPRRDREKCYGLPAAFGQEARPGTVGKEGLRKMHRQNWLNQRARQAWAIFRLAARKFLRIDGTAWAGAFAFNAFFSLFPLIVLLVTITSAFIDRDRAASEVIAYIEIYVPISGDMQAYIFDTIAGVIKVRGQAGVIAFLILVWVTLQCFTTLISATNHAWGTAGYSWWRLPLKSLVLLGITAGVALFSIGAPMLMQMAREWLFPMDDFRSWVYALGSFFIPLLVLFFSLSLFYRLAPRRPMRFSEVWVATLCTTALLLAAESLFVIYLKNFSTLNAVYGAFGGIMALLLWIHLSGSIFIFGACLCAAQAEARSAPADTIPPMGHT